MHRLNIGSFTVFLPKPWINIDILDVSQAAEEEDARFVQCDVLEGLPFDDGSTVEVNMSHVIEHFTVDEGLKVLQECRRVLAATGGRIRLGTPDLRQIARTYLDGGMDRYNDIQPDDYSKYSQSEKFWQLLTSGHKTVYDEGGLAALLKKAGYVNIQRVSYDEFYDMYPRLSLYMTAQPGKDKDVAGEVGVRVF